MSSMCMQRRADIQPFGARGKSRPHTFALAVLAHVCSCCIHMHTCTSGLHGCACRGFVEDVGQTPSWSLPSLVALARRHAHRSLEGEQNVPAHLTGLLGLRHSYELVVRGRPRRHMPRCRQSAWAMKPSPPQQADVAAGAARDEPAPASASGPWTVRRASSGEACCAARRCNGNLGAPGF